VMLAQFDISLQRKLKEKKACILRIMQCILHASQ